MKKLTSFILLFFSVIVFSQNSQKRIKEFNLEEKLAIQGYDPVSYFTIKKAIKGKKEISTVYDGVTYYFFTSENKKIFIESPTKYEPQYGGWCAYAMGDTGKKVEINPETFKIIGGKLYLFYNAYFNNTLKDWNKNEAKIKLTADSNWKKIVK